MAVCPPPWLHGPPLDGSMPPPLPPRCAGILRVTPMLGCVWDTFVLPIRGRNKAIVAVPAPLWNARCGRGGIQLGHQLGDRRSTLPKGQRF